MAKQLRQGQAQQAEQQLRIDAEWRKIQTARERLQSEKDDMRRALSHVWGVRYDERHQSATP
jgi:seryl-tRNA synthetase